MNAYVDASLPISDGRFDPIGGDLWLGGRQAKLRPRTAALLAHLVRNPHRVIGKDELMASVWPDAVVTEDSIVQCVKEIRRALGEEGRDWIRTIPRQGYAFVGPKQGAPAESLPALPAGHRWRWLASAAIVIAGALLFAGLSWRERSGDGPVAPPRSVVVLPLLNLTGDASKGDLVDEMTERLTLALAQLPGATVIAPGTAFKFKGQTIDARRVGAELGVRYVLEGSMRRRGSHQELSLRLADTASAVQLWHAAFAVEDDPMRVLHDDVLARVTGSLDLRLIGVDAQRSQRDHPVDPGAADLQMRAHASLRWAGQGQDAIMRAQGLLQQAVLRDPRLAEGWALLAMTYLDGIRFGNAREEALRQAAEAAGHALALAPDNAIVQEARAKVLYNQGRMAQAIEAFDRGIELNPNNPVLHAYRGASLTMLGRPEEGVTAILRAQRLSPRDPQTPAWLMLQGASLLHLGRDVEAAALLERSVQGNPESPFGRLFLASALGLTGRLDAAREQVAALQRIAPGFTIERMRAREPSDARAFRAQREHVYKGLRLAGLSE